MTENGGSAPIVFLDTETTGLSLDDEIWEVAALRCQDGVESDMLHLFVEHDQRKCAKLPRQFKDDHEIRYWPHRAVSRGEAARSLAEFIREGDHIVGAVPNFDTERIERLLRAFGHTPQWHYHLVDVENLAAGYLAGQGRVYFPPWDSEELSYDVGVDPKQFARHTAVGDVSWAKAIYEAVMKL